jgi:hypothetical protein
MLSEYEGRGSFSVRLTYDDCLKSFINSIRKLDPVKYQFIRFAIWGQLDFLCQSACLLSSVGFIHLRPSKFVTKATGCRLHIV